jgi:S1-C subfamily serine protease
VIAGQDDTVVETPPGETLDADAVEFDTRNDVAVLRVDGLRARPLPLTGPREGEPVAIIGYPEGGPLTAAAGRIGQTRAVVSEDAYGEGRVLRRLTSFRGEVRQGNSGGPAVNDRGQVETTVFASRLGSSGGFGVPADVVRRALASTRGVVSTGECAR